MNDLSNTTSTFKPIIPSKALYILTPIVLLGLSVSVSVSVSVSIFILITVHNALFFLLLSALVVSFLVWNTRRSATNAALLFFLDSLPDSDLALAHHDDLVKLTGVASCGSLSLESSYERATRCVYASIILFEYNGLNLELRKAWRSCFWWHLEYCERYSKDFYLNDRKSGLRAFVKAGSGCNLIPLVSERKLINTRKSRVLAPHLMKWLRERNLSAEPRRLLCLEEGYVQEGSTVTVFGMLHRSNETTMIVQPPEVISSGCQWRKLLLPVDIDGLVLRTSQASRGMIVDR